MAICQTGRLGEAIASPAGEHPAHGIVVVAQISRTDKHGPHVVARAKDRSHTLIAIQQRHPIAAAPANGSVATQQPGFSAAKRRHLENDAQVRCKSQAPRMSNSLTVAHHGVEGSRQAAQHVEHHRNFAKGEEPRNIRKVDPAARATRLQDAPSDDIPDHRYRENVVFRESAIQPDDSPRFRSRDDSDPIPQTILHGHRGARRETPSVRGPRNGIGAIVPRHYGLQGPSPPPNLVRPPTMHGGIRFAKPTFLSDRPT